MISREPRTQILISLALLLALNGYVEAQAFGRVTLVVKNLDGEPLEGVGVVVTCKELPKFREETKTNKKGRAVVSVTDATKFYDFHLEYEDYQPQDLTIKPAIRETITREITLTPGQVVRTGSGQTVFTPAEKVFNEGVVALQSGDMETAKTRFLAALEKDRDMASAHAALAGVYLEQKDFAAALTTVDRYLELEPGNPNGLFIRYDAHVGLGNQKEADATLKALKEADRGEDTVALIYNAGVSAIKVGNYASAKARFLEALELNPDLKEAIGAMAIIHLQEKNYQEAAASAERHLELEPGHKMSLRIRWDAYTQLGDAEKIQAAFEDLAAADPQVLIKELYDAGNELFDNGDVAGAKQKFEGVLAIDPEHARAHYRLGVCNASAENNTAAKEHLQRFIELAPEDPEAQVAKDMLGYLN